MLNQLDRIGKLTIGLALIGLTVLVGAELLHKGRANVKRYI